MATFEAQVEGLTSLSIDGSSAPTQTELTQFLTDGAKEILNVLPLAKKALYTTATSLNASSTNLTIGGSEIFSVTRDDGTINQPCRLIPANMSGRVGDSDDMNAASATDPVYYITNNVLSVIPEPTNSNNAQIQTLAYPSVAYGDSSITRFPDEAEYLVPLYASVKALQNVLGSKTSSTEITTALTAVNTEIDETLSIADNMHTEIAIINSSSDSALAEIALANIEIDKMATEAGLDNAELDKATAELAEAVTLVDSGIDTATAAIATAAGRINTAVGLANGEFDKAEEEADASESEVDDGKIDTALDLIKTQVDNAVTGVSDARTALSNANTRIATAKAEIDLAKTEAAEIATQTDNSGDFETACDAIKTELDKVDEIILLAHEEFDEVAAEVSSTATSPITQARSAVPSAISINDLNITSPAPQAPSLATVSYSDASNADASTSAVGAITVASVSKADISGDVPAYTKPGHPTQVSFEDFFNLSEDGNAFGDNDPGDFSTVAPPVPPPI